MGLVQDAIKIIFCYGGITNYSLDRDVIGSYPGT
jgi:hypothetical protein